MNRSTMNKLLLAAIPLVALTACGDSGVANVIGTAEPQVRLAHVAPGAPAVTLQRNSQNRNEATNVPFPTITNYFNTDNDRASYDVRVAGTGAPVGNVSIDAERGRKYTIFAVSEANGATSLAVLNDPTNQGVVNDEARVRVFNASANAQSVDVYTIGLSETIDSRNPDLATVGFKQAGPRDGTDSLNRRGGDYKIVVTTAGTKNVLAQGRYTIRDRQNVLIVTIPQVTPGTANVTGVRVVVKQGDDATVGLAPL